MKMLSRRLTVCPCAFFRIMSLSRASFTRRAIWSRVQSQSFSSQVSPCAARYRGFFNRWSLVYMLYRAAPLAQSAPSLTGKSGSPSVDTSLPSRT